MAHISFATDCTGLDAARVAMERLVETSQLLYKFGSEPDPVARALVERQSLQPAKFYIDARRHRVAAKVDIYICGPPCQSFSHQGYELGFESPLGKVLISCIGYIRQQLPTFFVIENVKSLMSHDSGASFRFILAQLASITDHRGNAVYHVEFNVISPHHLGYAQTRDRSFVVGRNKLELGPKVASNPFPWPKGATPPPLGLAKLLLSDKVAESIEPSCMRSSPPQLCERVGKYQIAL